MQASPAKDVISDKIQRCILPNPTLWSLRSSQLPSYPHIPNSLPVDVLIPGDVLTVNTISEEALSPRWSRARSPTAGPWKLMILALIRRSWLLQPQTLPLRLLRRRRELLPTPYPQRCPLSRQRTGRADMRSREQQTFTQNERAFPCHHLLRGLSPDHEPRRHTVTSPRAPPNSEAQAGGGARRTLPSTTWKPHDCPQAQWRKSGGAHHCRMLPSDSVPH